MTNRLRDSDLDLLLLDADPAHVVGLGDAVSAEGARELRDAIIAAPSRPAPPLRRRRVVAFAFAAAAAVAAALAVPVLSPASSGQDAYAATVVRYAERSPRLLMAAAGWRVTDANQTYEDAGSMTFGSAGRAIDIDWNSPASTFGNTADMPNERTVRIDGHLAKIGRLAGTGSMSYEAWWTVGDQGIRARGAFPNIDTFTKLMVSLHHVTVTAWLDAMPRYVVQPAARKAAVDAMLADIPQPDRLDPTALTSTNLVLDRYQIGARLSSAVGCGWLRLWFHGTAEQHRRASAAMATSRQWAILQEMAPEGGWAQAFWEVADFMNGVPKGNLEPGPGQTVEELAKNHLGC